MLELIEGMPEGIVGVRATGKVTAQDYRDGVVPAIERALEVRPKLRMVYELGADFPGVELGAAWEDARLGMHHLTKFERVAIVTDADWLRRTIHATAVFIPGQVRVYGSGESAAAREWVAAES